jgi:hypothetical protein
MPGCDPIFPFFKKKNHFFRGVFVYFVYMPGCDPVYLDFECRMEEYEDSKGEVMTRDVMR